LIEAVGVVVPAHDEETLLPSCLAALRGAASALRLSVHADGDPHPEGLWRISP
jgi:hypothetical protein